MQRPRTLLGPVGCVLLLLCFVTCANAAEWSRRYVTSLEDSAFAAIEVTPHGKKLRHLPHHDHTGQLDVPHLLSAMARIHQVTWIDAKNKEAAEQHLRDHMEAYKKAKLAKARAHLPLDLNSASTEDLMMLPFIGRKRAEAIIAYREKQGRIKAIDELRRVEGLGPAVFEAIADLVTVR